MTPELQNEIMELWDDASLTLVSMRPDPTHAVRLIPKLLDCADRARNAGYFFGERQLRRAAFDLQERLKRASATV